MVRMSPRNLAPRLAALARLAAAARVRERLARGRALNWNAVLAMTPAWAHDARATAERAYDRASADAIAARHERLRLLATRRAALAAQAGRREETA